MAENKKEDVTPDSSVPGSFSQSPRSTQPSVRTNPQEPAHQAEQAATFPHDVDFEDAPPPYGEIFGHIDNEQEDLGTRANVTGLLT